MQAQLIYDRLDFSARFALTILIIIIIIYSHYPHIQLSVVSHYVLLLLIVFVLFSLSPLSVCHFNSILIHYLFYDSNLFIFLMNFIIYFII